MTTDQAERIRMLHERRAAKSGPEPALPAAVRGPRPKHAAERSRIAVAGAATALTLGLTGLMTTTAGAGTQPNAAVAEPVAAATTVPPRTVVVVVRSSSTTRGAMTAPASTPSAAPERSTPAQAPPAVAAAPVPIQVTPQPVPVTRTNASR